MVRLAICRSAGGFAVDMHAFAQWFFNAIRISERVAYGKYWACVST